MEDEAVYNPFSLGMDDWVLADADIETLVPAEAADESTPLADEPSSSDGQDYALPALGWRRDRAGKQASKYTRQDQELLERVDAAMLFGERTSWKVCQRPSWTVC